uniref:Uncharacterized protein n=1 Tax=Peronospora matthiolae TaxID=2874970 RepID=A0AAV1TCQ3_9STRA
MVDPREHPTSTVEVPKAHSGTQPVGVDRCERTQHFVTCGSDTLMQKRELKLWDPRRMAKCLHRERVDAGVGGQLFLLYDPIMDLLFALGKRSCSARIFEADVMRAPCVHALNCSTSSDSTLAALAATLLFKSVCDMNVCEVARVLNLSTSGTSGGVSCKVISYRVPRNEATYTFQSDLYLDTLSKEAATTSEEWLRGQNAYPRLETVTPTVKGADDVVENVLRRLHHEIFPFFGCLCDPQGLDCATDATATRGAGYTFIPYLPPSLPLARPVGPLPSQLIPRVQLAQGRSQVASTLLWGGFRLKCPPRKEGRLA